MLCGRDSYPAQRRSLSGPFGEARSRPGVTVAGDPMPCTETFKETATNHPCHVDWRPLGRGAGRRRSSSRWWTPLCFQLLFRQGGGGRARAHPAFIARPRSEVLSTAADDEGSGDDDELRNAIIEYLHELSIDDEQKVWVMTLSTSHSPNDQGRCEPRC